ncbi:MAG: hypothetical protein HFI78_01560 [Lachnospiraceae bacterium]|nr:hypothetical protein [Lachnospiraceae bacterium]
MIIQWTFAWYTVILVYSLGLAVKLWIGMQYYIILKSSENMSHTKNLLLLQIKNKFENSYKVDGSMRNVEAFVYKSLIKYKCFGITIGKWKRISQLLLAFALLIFIFLIVYCKDNIYFNNEIWGAEYLLMGGTVYIFISVVANVRGKERDIQVNINNYLENYYESRLLIEQERRKSFQKRKEEVDRSITTKKEEEKGSLLYEPDLDDKTLKRLIEEILT